MSFIEVARGASPLLLGLPHTGTELPDDAAARLSVRGAELADTDWHVDELYAGLAEGLTTVRTRIHRYVIDVNRDPDGSSLYPGKNTTDLCPITDFDGLPIYHDGQEPDTNETARRRDQYHASYHAALVAELERLRDLHGFAILYDCHSIRSQIPFLFDGRLADLNIGTDAGRTCDGSIEAGVHNLCLATGDYTTVLNGRFKGGWTTRQYGRPAEGWHALQMEIAQSAYLTDEAPPWHYDHEKSARLRRHLGTVLRFLQDWRPA